MWWRRGRRLRLHSFRHPYFLTGAGVSVASGMPVFRSADGELPQTLAETLDATFLPGSLLPLWSYCLDLARQADAASPNAAHLAIASARERLRSAGASSTLATMNIDGLHVRAGDRDVLELHGSVLRTRCTSCQAGEPELPDVELAGADTPPTPSAHPSLLACATSEPFPPPCRFCGAPLRPDVVLYREPTDTLATWRSRQALREADLVVVVGSSRKVTTVDSVLRAARFTGARTVGVNPDPDKGEGFDEFHVGRAEDVLPELLAL